MAETNGISPRIGIISGSGPDAGLNIFQKVCAEHRTRLGPKYQSDKDAPSIMLYQVPGIGGPHGSWDLDDRTCAAFQKLWEGICTTISQLADHNADVVCLPCNTLHVLEPEIRQYMEKATIRNTKFLSIIEATEVAILEELPVGDKSGKVAILGTLMVTDQDRSPYGKIQGNPRVDVVSLDQAMRNDLQKLIIDTKRDGPQAPGLRKTLRECVESLLDTTPNLSSIVLACSELPLLLDDAYVQSLEGTRGVSIIDPNLALARGLLNHQSEANTAVGLNRLGFSQSTLGGGGVSSQSSPSSDENSD